MTIDPGRIEEEMHRLEKILSYTFNNLSYLKKAMESRLIEKTKSKKGEYSNDGLATVGDTILKAVIADKLYATDGITKKCDITKKKELLENNKTLHKVVLSEGILDYAYNEDHFRMDENDTNSYANNRVVSKGHDPYLEAIVAAVYYDSGFEKTKEWIHGWLLRRLEKNKADK